MTKQLVEIIDKNGVRTRRWKNVSDKMTDNTLSKVSPASISDRQEMEIREDFSSSECWVLAKHLHEQNPERYKIAMLDDGEGGWIHAFVKDTANDTYIDIDGEQTTDELMMNWDWNPEWTEIVDGDVSEFDGDVPDKNRSSLDDALALLKKNGVEIESRPAAP